MAGPELFRKHFRHVETRYFWLTTLVIFVLMAVVQRRNPNKERFWKVVVQEGEKWRWLTRRLLDWMKFILRLLPPLRLLCWNVVTSTQPYETAKPDPTITDRRRSDRRARRARRRNRA